MSKKKPASRKVVSTKPISPAAPMDLLADVRTLIEQARDAVASAVNSALVLLYWSIGDRIRRDILKEKRADYGAKILGTLSQELSAHYGKGYTYDNLTRMVRLAEVFSDREIVGELSRQLSWSHFVLLLPLADPLRREFYAELCRMERWSVRTLRQKIGGMLYERTALSRKSDDLIREELATLRDEDRLTPDLVFRDPYLLDFLGLKDTYSEEDLENAILREIESVLLELGSDFAFLTRQKRITIDGRDYRLDLLFYHRSLRRLVAVELKLEPFEAAHKGQMELYLRWLAKHEMRPGEEPPLGLILCAGSSSDHVELLEMDRAGIRVAEYLTELPPRPLLEAKLHTAIHHARERLKEVSQ